MIWIWSTWLTDSSPLTPPADRDLVCTETKLLHWLHSSSLTHPAAVLSFSLTLLYWVWVACLGVCEKLTVIQMRSAFSCWHTGILVQTWSPGNEHLILVVCCPVQQESGALCLRGNFFSTKCCNIEGMKNKQLQQKGSLHCWLHKPSPLIKANSAKFRNINKRVENSSAK